jgi:Xaa-Pro aminopeptidase
MSDATAQPEYDVSPDRPVSDNWVWAGFHRPPIPRALVDHMTSQWAPVELSAEVHPAAAHFAARRLSIGRLFSDATLVVPTGNPKVRANDTDYRFRAGTDFFYLTGCQESDSVLVISPSAAGPRSTLYVAPRRDSSSHDFYTDARYGELWVGPRRGVAECATYYDVATAPIEDLEKDLASLSATRVIGVRGVDASVDALVEQGPDDLRLLAALSEMRLVKDEYEVAQLEEAVRHTVRGFEDVVRALPRAVGRGERVIEGVFNLRARVEGNDVGYDTIAATGRHSTILHWMRNDGDVHLGDLLLLDAGVECHQLYTADVTRTLPINGKFSRAQRHVYSLVLAAQQAALDAVAPGVEFRHPHRVAMRVLCEGLHEMGILKETPEEALRPERQLHRRYTLHGTSHMLGIDVHDCANARDEMYHGELHEGYVLTIEPGLYFQANDLSVPEEYRGIGVRIEDDVLVTAQGARNLSAALPRDPDEIEEWMAQLWQSGPGDLSLG